MEAFCAAEGIDYEICGKVIVATSEAELPALQRIYERGQENGVRCAMIDREHLHELEPHAAGIKAIHVPESGIVNYPQVCQRLAARIQERDEPFASDLAQAILVSHLDLIKAVLDDLGVPNEDGFFAKDTDVAGYLKEGWQQRVWEKFRPAFPPAALLFYINHLAWEVAKAEEVFAPAA